LQRLDFFPIYFFFLVKFAIALKNIESEIEFYFSSLTFQSYTKYYFLLQELAQKHGERNWYRIDQELGTGRGAFQTYARYQSCLNSSMRKSKWTNDEDAFLEEIIKRCRIGSYIPWGKVSRIAFRYKLDLRKN